MTDKVEPLAQAVHRPWGFYESLLEAPGYQVKRLVVNPGGRLSLQKHFHRAEHWTVVAGTAHITVGQRVGPLQVNESVFIPKEEIHRIENFSEQTLVIIEVQCGDYLGEDDIVRFDDVYGRAGEKV